MEVKKRSNRRDIFLFLAVFMAVAGIIFLCFTLAHPELGFSWPNFITYSLYTAYIIIVLVFLMIWGKRGDKE